MIQDAYISVYLLFAASSVPKWNSNIFEKPKISAHITPLAQDPLK